MHSGSSPDHSANGPSQLILRRFFLPLLYEIEHNEFETCRKERVMSNNENLRSNAWKEALEAIFLDSKLTKKTLRFIALLTAIGTIVTLVSSSYKADLFSEYYGIPLCNLDVLSTAMDMTIIFGPLFLLLLISRYIVYFVVSIITDSISFTQRNVKSIIVVVSLFFYYIVYRVYCIPDATVYDESLNDNTLLVAILIIASGAVVSFLMSFPKLKGLVQIVCTSILIVVAYLGLVATLTAASKYMISAYPQEIKSYEIVNVSGVDYAIVCSSDDRKLAIECDIDRIHNSLRLHYGQYRFIESNEYEYVYHTFDIVDCPNTSKVNLEI